MLEQRFGVVPAGSGWHLAVIHEHEPDKIHLYAIAAWLVTESEDGDPELVPFISHCHMGAVPLGVFSPEGELAAAVISPDGTLDEQALRERAAAATERV